LRKKKRENQHFSTTTPQYEFNVPHLLCCSDCETLTIGELLALPRNDGAPDPGWVGSGDDYF
jgi:hypothetical protein